MDFDALPGNLARVRDEIAAIQAREDQHGNVRIVGVTKGHPVGAVHAACAAGLLDLGENRVQEALEKQAQLPELPVRWHMIGHLQTNKTKSVPGRFAMVHSIDSVRVADALERALERHGTAAPLPVLVQVNIAGEEQKDGCDPVAAPEIVAHVASLRHLRLNGLMTMAPFTDEERVQRRVFGRLRTLRDQLVADGGWDLRELSMGMSDDYPSAVAEGATIVRLGTVLFGARPR